MLCEPGPETTVDAMNESTAPALSPYDVVVVGGGAAGLSAALVLARARRRVLVVDSNAPRNAPAAHMHGYLSRDGMPPTDLLAAGRDEVARYGGQVVTDTVTDVAASGTDDRPGFRLRLSGGRLVTARRLLVATGLRDELPDITGLRERWARDVLHCPYCHGWEVRDQRLGVLVDGSPESVRYAHIVRQWSHDVVVFGPEGALSEQHAAELAARGIRIVVGDVSRVLVEDDRLLGVELADGRSVRRDALFVPPRFVPNADLLTRLGAEADDRGWVQRDAAGRTTVPGVWTAGNVANPRAQVITAAGEGSAAAIDLNADIVDDDVRHDVRTAHTTTMPPTDT
jgi:thioredoxin reductase